MTFLGFCFGFLGFLLDFDLDCFLDLTEGDKLAFWVVELHVGPRRPCDALGNEDQVFVVFAVSTCVRLV